MNPDMLLNRHRATPRLSVIYLYPYDIAAYHQQARRNGLVVPDLQLTFHGTVVVPHR
jgi:hypothetical protein